MCATMGVVYIASSKMDNSAVFANGGSNPYQIVLTKGQKTQTWQGNTGGKDYVEYNFSTTTTGGSPFTGKCTIWESGYLDGSISYEDNAICIADFSKGDIYAEVNFTLREIASPTNVILDGEFRNSTASAADTNQLVFNSFTDNGDGSYTIVDNCASSHFMYIKINTITINYTCSY